MLPQVFHSRIEFRLGIFYFASNLLFRFSSLPVGFDTRLGNSACLFFCPFAALRLVLGVQFGTSKLQRVFPLGVLLISGLKSPLR